MIDKEMRKTICEQIGFGNILSISGGRVIPTDTGINLPVSHGYHVHVEYNEGCDDYTITRIFKRGNKEFIRGRVKHVYCDQVGELAYRAGMFHSWDENQWPVA